MSFKLSDAADFIDGEIFGQKDLEIFNLARIEEAKVNDLTFLYHPSYEKFFNTTKASAIIVKPGFNKSRSDITYLEAKDPNKAFSKLIIKYFTPDFPLEKGIDESASVHPSAVVGKEASIGKNVVIGAGSKVGKNAKIFHNSTLLENVEVGDDSIIFSNVSIREDCKLGERVIIHSGTVIGSDGFGFYTDESGRYIKIPQIGNVVIEDDVEIGANVTIDRAALGSTILKKGVKIDNLIQIAHNVVIGENTVMAAQSGVAGSTKIGNNVILAAQSGVVGHIEIGDNVIIMAQSGISKSLPKPGAYFGSPAKEIKTALKLEAHLRNLPEYSEKIQMLEKEIEELKLRLKA
jgi:UDP-3-O-[3-hydroxymyristoyl] glucosamine N-acyltransferase